MCLAGRVRKREESIVFLPDSDLSGWGAVYRDGEYEEEDLNPAPLAPAPQPKAMPPQQIY